VITRDRVKYQITVTLQRISFLSVWIENTINIFVWDIIANKFYIIAGYSLPGCDLINVQNTDSQYIK